MPKLDPGTAALFMSKFGAELLLGNPIFQIDSAARTDVLAGNGEYQVYKSGASLFLRIFDKDDGAWREVALT